MSIFKGLVGVAALAVSTAAMAAPTHLTDVQYMQASRCRALIASSALGKEDTSSIDALLKTESAGRPAYVDEKAGEMQRDATRLAKDASPERKATLIAERDTACVAYNGGASTMTQAAHPATSN